MLRVLVLLATAAVLSACDDSLPSNCSTDAAHKLIRAAYQGFYSIEAQTPAMPAASGFLGLAMGAFQAGTKARAVEIAGMSPSEIKLQDVVEVASGGAIKEQGVKRFRVCAATVVIPLPGAEKVHVAIYEMSAGGDLQTEIEAAP